MFTTTKVTQAIQRRSIVSNATQNLTLKAISLMPQSNLHHEKARFPLHIYAARYPFLSLHTTYLPCKLRYSPLPSPFRHKSPPHLSSFQLKHTYTLTGTGRHFPPGRQAYRHLFPQSRHTHCKRRQQGETCSLPAQAHTLAFAGGGWTVGMRADRASAGVSARKRSDQPYFCCM
jgi:hypothetical protein